MDSVSKVIHSADEIIDASARGFMHAQHVPFGLFADASFDR